MSKHTPGPWGITHYSSIAGIAIFGGGAFVARISGGEEAQSIANARLIAAAPELLASVRDLLDWLDDGNRVLSDACAADVQKARAALAKAEGAAPKSGAAL